MRPIIHSEFSGFMITEGLNNRHGVFVPEPGPQPETEATAAQVKMVRNTFGNRLKTFFGFGAPARSARVRNRYQRNF